MPITIYHEEDGTIVGLSAASADAAPIELTPDQATGASYENRGGIRSIRIEEPAGSTLQFDSPERLGELFDDIVKNYRVDGGTLAKKCASS